MSNIENFYRKSPYYIFYIEDIKDILSKKHDNLSELSIELILKFIDILQIDTKILRSSEICKGFKGQGIDKIFYILDKLKATEYISSDGPGSLRYIKEEDFIEKNIKLTWQKFKHPIYQQTYGEFISHLSIIDLLFNCGAESKNYIT